MKCGAPLAADARQDFCPACLYAQAAADSSAPDLDEKCAPEAGLGFKPVGPQSLASFPSLFADYELLAKLGEGGMGVVYKARQRSLDRLVALKMLPLTGPHARPEYIKRFRAEAVAAASLQHPHIVAIHEVGIHDGQHFFAMEYVAGRSLSEIVGNRPLPARRAAGYLQTIAEAVHYAHERGILHRDLKPSNILIDDQDQPRIADFGLAKRLDSDSELTLTGQVLGSPHYIPPEQAAGKHSGLSRRSDVYGLGAILYHLLTGRPPFVGEQMAETLQLVLNTEPVAPRLLNPLVPRDLETICLKCLEKEPARRYSTAQAVAEELAHFLRGEPIAARPVGFLGRLGRWCRRKPALAAALAALVISVGLGLAGVLWQWREASRYAAAEHQERIRAEHRLWKLELTAAEDFLRRPIERPTGLALLAGVLRRHANGTNCVAPQRIVSMLSWCDFPLPVAECTGIATATWSPVGDRVATGSTNGEARVWNVADGQPLGPAMRHASPVSSVAFAPDGRWLATGTADGSARVWNSISGEPRTPILKHSNSVVWVEFTPDGKCVATGTERGALRVWDAETGRPMTPPLQHGSGFAAARFSPDGRTLIVAAGEELAKLEATDSERPFGRFSASKNRVRSIEISPDANWVLAMETNSLRVLEVAASKFIFRPMPHPARVLSATFSPDGQRVVSTCADGRLRVWEVRTGRLLANWPFLEDQWSGRRGDGGSRPDSERERIGREPSRGGKIQFSPDGHRVVFTADERTVRFWNALELGTAAPYHGEVIPHLRAVRRVAFSPDGHHLLILSVDGVARVWDVRPGAAESVSLTGDRFERAQFSPDGRRVLTAELSGFARLWDSFTGKEICPPMAHSNAVPWAEFSPDGQRVATASRDHTARVWDARTGQGLIGPLRHEGPVHCVRFSRDGRCLVTASDDRTARIWDALNGAALTPPLAHSQAATWAAFSQDGQRAVTASLDGAARVWDTRTGQLVCPPLKHAQAVRFATFTRDGKRVVTASDDGTARFWNAFTGQPLPPVLKHAGAVTVVRLNADETLAATASSDTTACVWELATGKAIATRHGHTRPVDDVRFSPDGRWLATASADVTAQLLGIDMLLPASNLFAPDGPIHNFEFSPDGQRLLTATPRYVVLWDMPSLSVPVAPAWLAQLAEAVAGRRVSELS
jgi:WD40 repeat protein/predicted Ser/Thr protein kinase